MLFENSNHQIDEQRNTSEEQDQPVIKYFAADPDQLTDTSPIPLDKSA